MHMCVLISSVTGLSGTKSPLSPRLNEWRRHWRAWQCTRCCLPLQAGWQGKLAAALYASEMHPLHNAAVRKVWAKIWGGALLVLNLSPVLSACLL